MAKSSQREKKVLRECLAQNRFQKSRDCKMGLILRAR